MSEHNKTAVIVPYRARYDNHNEFIPYMIKFLNDDGLDYHIFIIEQGNNNPFNRGALLNIGVYLLSEEYNYFVLHDMGYVPISCDYSNMNDQFHLGSKIDKFDFRSGFFGYYGGITKTCKKVFEEINGFSNLYQGWGAEDDDLRNRYFKKYNTIKRISSVFVTLPHPKPILTDNYKKNVEYLNSTYDYQKEGYNQINKTFFFEIKYKVDINDKVTKYVVNFPIPK